MKKLTAIALLVLLPTTAFAQEVQSIPEGADKITHLKLNMPAPYDGQLYDNATALRWANWLQQYKLRLKLDVETQKSIYEAKLSYGDTILKAERTAAKDRLDLVLKQLDTTEKARDKYALAMSQSNFWDSREFGIVLGVVGATLLFVLGAYAAGHL